MNKKHYEILKRGMIHWNYWRNKNSDIKPDLFKADLRNADLSCTDLHNTDLGHANLTEANLCHVYLTGTNLRYANLLGADLSYSNLRGADLSYSDLRCTDLYNADLGYANLINAKLPNFQICPPSGEFIAWKKGECDSIIKLKIPWWARRCSNLTGRKCRTEFAIVLSIEDCYGNPLRECNGMHDKNFIYKVGSIVKPDNYDPDIRLECTHGIHFFITKQEAIKW